MARKHLIVLSSPSGGGKSTVARHLQKIFPQIRFSVSATTRSKRPLEEHGREYYFISKEEFQSKISANELIEYEEIFGNYYGTLRSTVEEAIANDEVLLFDIDVKGALSLKKAFPEESLLIFLSPPSMYELEKRLRRRSTETEEQIATRLARAEMELAKRDRFDYLLINKDLNDTLLNAENIVRKNIT